jgi:heptosyltransferase-2
MCQEPLEGLFARDERVDHVVTFQRKKGVLGRVLMGREAIFKLRQEPLDVGILATRSWSSAWWFWQGGVRKRIGYGGRGRDWLLTTSLPLEKGPLHHVERYAQLLSPWTATTPFSPSLIVGEDEMLQARKRLGDSSLWVAIHPGAAYGSAKCWPLKYYEKLAHLLLEDRRIKIVWVGDRTLKPAIDLMEQRLPSFRSLSLMGATTLRELMGVLKVVDMFVTNDSGPMHIRAAFGKPLVALFGSTDPIETGPYRMQESVARHPVPCSPCFRRTCPIGLPCMYNMTPVMIADRVLRELFPYTPLRRHSHAL